MKKIRFLYIILAILVLVIALILLYNWGIHNFAKSFGKGYFG